MRFKEKLIRFMYGRYGSDNLYRFLTVVFYVLFVINLFLGSYILSALTMAVLFYATFRVFSRNIIARRRENDKYLKIKASFCGFFKLGRDRFKDRKTHVYRKCPACHSVLRFKRTKGKHTAVCPKCSHRFNVKV